MGPEAFDRSRTFLAGVRTDKLVDQALSVPGSGGDLATKVLSRSSDGSVSQVVSAPGGWTAGGARSFSALTEVFVLDGTMNVDTHVLQDYSYLRIPAGATVSNIEVGGAGCRFLMFSTGLLELIPATGEAGETNLEPLSLHAMSWVASTTPGVTPGLLHKRLAEDPDTGARTWIIGLIHWGSGDQQVGDAPLCGGGLLPGGGHGRTERYSQTGSRMIPYEAGGILLPTGGDRPLRPRIRHRHLRHRPVPVLERNGRRLA